MMKDKTKYTYTVKTGKVGMSNEEYELAIKVKDKLANEIQNNTNKYMKNDFFHQLEFFTE